MIGKGNRGKEKSKSDGMAGEEERINVFTPAACLFQRTARSVFMNDSIILGSFQACLECSMIVRDILNIYG